MPPCLKIDSAVSMVETTTIKLFDLAPVTCPSSFFVSYISNMDPYAVSMPALYGETV